MNWGFKIAVLALSVPASLYAQTSGTVLDPQDYFVSGALVVLSCAHHTQTTSTDAHGRFGFERTPETESCGISVTLEGFQPFYKIVTPSESVVVRLNLKILNVVVNVVADSDNADRLAKTTLSSVSLSDIQLK